MTARTKEDKTFIFLQNFGSESVKVNLPKGKVLLGDESGELEPLDSIVIYIY